MPTIDEIADRTRQQTADANAVPLRLQIAEVEREIALRRNVYPKWTRTGKMRPGEAEEHQRRMQAVLETLQKLETQDGATKGT